MGKRDDSPAKRLRNPQAGSEPPATREDEGSSSSGVGNSGDVAIAVGKDENGIHILRRRGEGAAVEAGVVQPLTSGKPIRGEVISMRQRPDLPLVFDVKTELADPSGDEPRATSAGPSQVATESYRKGWDAIWGRKRVASGPVN